MNSIEHYLQYVRERLLAEHKIVEKALIKYLDMVRGGTPRGTTTPSQLDRIIETLERYLVPHIEFEEREALPLTADRALAEELSRDHREILELLRSAREAGDAARKIELLSDLADKLNVHVRKEETRLLPKILGDERPP